MKTLLFSITLLCPLLYPALQAATFKDLFPFFEYLQPDKSSHQPKDAKNFCLKLDNSMKSYEWKVPSCSDFTWEIYGHTKEGHPLVFTEIGHGNDVTMIFSGVHPDELNPIPVAMRLLGEVKKKSFLPKNKKLVLVPLVNPDGFFRKTALRTNANGVDLNRNFNTDDWFSQAHKAWSKRNRRLRYFPGWSPNSEIETKFQKSLIDKYQPQKILSLHAPLGIIDYDINYSRDANSERKNKRLLKKFAREIVNDNKEYRIIDFNVYPGSLGNYAGVERNIPTFTIELTDSNPKNFEKHWSNIHKGLLFAVTSELHLTEVEKAKR